MNETTDFALDSDRIAGISERRHILRRVADRIPHENSQLAFSTASYLVYFLTTAAMIQGVVLLSRRVDAHLLFAENGPVEWFQLVLLLACFGCLQTAAYRIDQRREIFHLLALLPLAAAVREMDAILDRSVFDGAWQLIVTLLVLHAFFFIRRHRLKVTIQLQPVLASGPFGLLIAGFLVVMVFSRLIGQQLFWRAALQEQYLRLVGRIVEESCELFGYLLLLFGCIEILRSSFSDLTIRRPLYREE
ncbi:MAG: hypothetical protein LLH30_18890 [Candidatus Manganitrophus sp. SA1]|nr:hypothetical protein [Candidatus Manganitrophus morganii]